MDANMKEQSRALLKAANSEKGDTGTHLSHQRQRSHGRGRCSHRRCFVRFPKGVKATGPSGAASLPADDLPYAASPSSVTYSLLRASLNQVPIYRCLAHSLKLWLTHLF